MAIQRLMSAFNQAETLSANLPHDDSPLEFASPSDSDAAVIVLIGNVIAKSLEDQAAAFVEPNDQVLVGLESRTPAVDHHPEFLGSPTIITHGDLL